MSIYHTPQNDAPDPIDRNAALVKKISATRPPVYSDHCLIIGRGSRKKAGSRGADGEFRRRNAERELYMELSRYYLLEQNHSAWARAKLLSRGKHGHDHSDL